MEFTPHLTVPQPQYPDPADIMRISEGMGIIDEWAEQTDATIAATSASLLKKINISTISIKPPDYPDFNNFPEGFVRAEGVFLNSPSGDANFIGEVFTRRYGASYYVQTAVQYKSAGGDTFIRQYGSNAWKGWQKTAISQPPQELPFPASSAYYTTGAFYTKDQFNMVTVYGAIHKISGSIAQNDVMGNLPEGYRPSAMLELPAVYWPTHLAGSVAIHPSGLIAVPAGMQPGSSQYCYIIASYLAAN